MRILTVIAGAFALLSLIGCTGETSTPSGRVVSALREVGGAVLRRDAEVVANRVTAQEPYGPTKIPENLWTDSLRKFKPEYIYWGNDSLTIVTSRSERYENGIVVYFPSHPDDTLASGEFAGGGSGRGDYKIEAGVYWFWQKIRSDAALKRKLQDLERQTNETPNQITGPNAGGPRLFATRTSLAARVGQFQRWRSVYEAFLRNRGCCSPDYCLGSNCVGCVAKQVFPVTCGFAQDWRFQTARRARARAADGCFYSQRYDVLCLRRDLGVWQQLSIPGSFSIRHS